MTSVRSLPAVWGIPQYLSVPCRLVEVCRALPIVRARYAVRLLAAPGEGPPFAEHGQGVVLFADIVGSPR